MTDTLSALDARLVELAHQDDGALMSPGSSRCSIRCPEAAF
jgi:hypothetical protein